MSRAGLGQSRWGGGAALPLGHKPPAKNKPAGVPYGIRIADTKADLVEGKERPQWILSTFGPGKNAPASLFEGNESSFEELRVRFYEAAAAGNPQLALNEATGLWTKAEAAMRDVVNNIDDVVKFEEQAGKQHPNRLDLCKMDGKKTVEDFKRDLQSQAPNTFGAATNTFGSSINSNKSFGTSSPTPRFGSTQNSAFGNPSLTFGGPAALTGLAPAFGQPSRPTGLGQPSFGQASNPQASAFGQPAKTPAFGQTGFGQPSAPNQPTPFGTSRSSGFGQPSAPAFGKPSAPTSTFGQPTTGTSTFGQPSQPTSSFGQPPQAGGFGQTGFGQSSQPQTTTAQSGNPFTRTSSASNNPFNSANSNNASSFGAPSNTAAKPSNPFQSTTSTAVPAFGSPTPPAPSTGIFRQPPSNTAPPRPSPTHTTSLAVSTGDIHPLTGLPAKPIVYTQTLPKNPPTYRKIQDRSTGRPTQILETYRGLRVTYKDDKPEYQRPDGKGWERIWFPDGPPALREEELEGKPEDYTDEVINAYKSMLINGKFENGRIPAVPPKVEWGSCDF